MWNLQHVEMRLLGEVGSRWRVRGERAFFSSYVILPELELTRILSTLYSTDPAGIPASPPRKRSPLEAFGSLWVPSSSSCLFKS